MSRVEPVVSAAWLRQQLEAGRTDLVVIEACFEAADHLGAHNQYIKEHIKSALFYDMNNSIKPRPTCPRNLQEADDFQEYVRSLGINNNTHIVVYDRQQITLSPKTWWTFRVFGHNAISVLNGGLGQWKAEGGEMVPGEEKSQTVGDFEVKMKNMSLVTTYEEMLSIIQNKTAQIVDCRLKEHFYGQEPEPSLYVRIGLESMGMPIPPPMHAGHMVGAVHIFLFSVLEEGSLLFLPKEKLQKLFSDSGIDLSKPLVTTCYMGHTASMINMAAFLCGYENTSLYYGSWTEFGQLAPAELVDCSAPEK